MLLHVGIVFSPKLNHFGLQAKSDGSYCTPRFNALVPTVMPGMGSGAEIFKPGLHIPPLEEILT